MKAKTIENENAYYLYRNTLLQIVLLGDHKQIRPIVACARVKDLGMATSLFERYMDCALMLDTQYRMVYS